LFFIFFLDNYLSSFIVWINMSPIPYVNISPVASPEESLLIVIGYRDFLNFSARSFAFGCP